MGQLNLANADLIKYQNILSALYNILEETNNSPQANIILDVQNALNKKNYNDIRKVLNSVDMWGGAGAVWEVYIDNEIQEKKFKQEIIKLIDLMEETNLLGSGIKRIKKILKED